MRVHHGVVVALGLVGCGSGAVAPTQTAAVEEESEPSVAPASAPAQPGVGRQLAIGGARICLVREGHVLCRERDAFVAVPADDRATENGVGVDGACVIGCG